MRIESKSQLKEFLNNINYDETKILYVASGSHEYFTKVYFNGWDSFVFGKFKEDWEPSDYLFVIKKNGEYEEHSLLDRNVDKQNGYNKTYWFTDEDEAKLFVSNAKEIKDFYEIKSIIGTEFSINV